MMLTFDARISGIAEEQLILARKIVSHFTELWNEIKQVLLELHPDLGDTSDVAKHLISLGIEIPKKINANEDWSIQATFDLCKYTGYFVDVSNWVPKAGNIVD